MGERNVTILLDRDKRHARAIAHIDLQRACVDAIVAHTLDLGACLACIDDNTRHASRADRYARQHVAVAWDHRHVAVRQRRAQIAPAPALDAPVRQCARGDHGAPITVS